MQSLKFAGYANEMVYATVDQIIDPSYPPRIMNDALCSVLARSFYIYTFEYACGFLAAYVSAAVNLSSSVFATAAQEGTQRIATVS